jgi:hypothetical protein
VERDVSGRRDAQNGATAVPHLLSLDHPLLLSRRLGPDPRISLSSHDGLDLLLGSQASHVGAALHCVHHGGSGLPVVAPVRALDAQRRAVVAHLPKGTVWALHL